MSARNIVIVIGVSTSSLVALIIIIAIAFGFNKSQEMYTWGGVIIGFYFGTFATFVLQQFGGGRPGKAEKPGQPAPPPSP
jgi:hypothetical protein